LKEAPAYYFREGIMDPLVYKAVNKARIALTHGEKTFVVVDDTKLLYFSKARGFTPLFEVFDTRPDLLEGGIVGDRIVGRGAAMFFLHAKVKAVFALAVSDEAIDILQDHKVIITWKETVPYIVERDLTSRYKLDLSIQDVEDPAEAVNQIRRAVFVS
jgi:hypothetical protein